MRDETTIPEEPTDPRSVPGAQSAVDATIAPCSALEAKITMILKLVDGQAVLRDREPVLGVLWSIPDSDYHDGKGSTHPGLIPTAEGSDAAMVIIVEVTKAEGLSGSSEIIGELSDGEVIRWKGTLPLSVGEHEITVTAEETTRLRRHRGDVRWYTDVPGCGRKVLGTTCVEIYRMVAPFSDRLRHEFLSSGIPVEGLRLLYERTGINGMDATPVDDNHRQIIGAIATYLHNGHGLTYDTYYGAARFYEANPFALGRFHFYDYVKGRRRDELIVNCVDQASGVQALVGCLGIFGNKINVRPFGYINTTVLVGGTLCNSPFYSQHGTAPVVDRHDPDRVGFGHHEFFYATRTGKIFDACVGPHLGTETLDEYLEASVDVDMPIGEYDKSLEGSGLETWGRAWVIQREVYRIGRLI